MSGVLVFALLTQVLSVVSGSGDGGVVDVFRYASVLLCLVCFGLMVPQLVRARGVGKAADMKRVLLAEGLCPCCSDDLNAGKGRGSERECATCGAVWRV